MFERYRKCHINVNDFNILSSLSSIYFDKMEADLINNISNKFNECLRLFEEIIGHYDEEELASLTDANDYELSDEDRRYVNGNGTKIVTNIQIIDQYMAHLIGDLNYFFRNQTR